MTAWTRVVTGAARLGAASALAAARVRAAALLRPAADSIRAGSPRWRAAVRPAIDELLQRTRPALSDLVAVLRDPPALSDLVAVIRDRRAPLRLRPRGTEGEEVVLHRPVAEPDEHARAGPLAAFLRRLARRSRRPETGSARRPLASEPYGDDLLDDDSAEDDDDRGIFVRLYRAVRRLRSTRGWKRVEDVILDLDRIRTFYRWFTNGGRSPQQLPRRLTLIRRPRTAHAPPRASSAPRAELQTQATEWWLLACIPRVVDVEMPAGIDVVFSAAPPPMPSTLVVGDQLSGAFTSTDEPYPFVSAVADHGHVLLLHARAEDGADDTLYYVCDIWSGAATLLPPPDALLGVLLPDCFAILSHGEDDYIIVALQPGETCLLYYESCTSAWGAIPVAVDGVTGDWDWEGHAVVAQGRSIVWCDLGVGFLWWEVDGDDVLRFLPLPPGRARPPGAVGLDRLRCATLCQQGQLRYAEIVDEAHRPLLELWIFHDRDRTWRREASVGFHALWDGAATGLPRASLAFIHPDHVQKMIYVLLGSRIYAVDLRLRRVVAEMTFDLHAPSQESLSSRFLHAWTLSA